jgi:hypothetical protein
MRAFRIRHWCWAALLAGAASPALADGPGPHWPLFGHHEADPAVADDDGRPHLWHRLFPRKRRLPAQAPPTVAPAQPPAPPPQTPPAPSAEVPPSQPPTPSPTPTPTPTPEPRERSGEPPGAAAGPEAALPADPLAGLGGPSGGAADLFSENAGAGSSGLGGVLSGTASAIVMQGDLPPIARSALSTPFVPPAPPEPPNGRGRFTPKGATIVTSIRSFKFADNQTPFPVDRILFSFNYFDNVNGPINKRFDVPLGRTQAFQYTVGFEKTLLDKNASFGMRLPIDSLTAQGVSPGFGGTSSSVGDLGMYFKYALWQDRPRGRVVSTGLALTAPTGPGSFAGADYLRRINHDTFLQPFVGFQWQWDRAYVMNFLAIDTPLGPGNPTMLYEDFAIGYFVYRNTSQDAWLRGVAPLFETHVNIPLNDRDWSNPRSATGTPDMVDLTMGTNFFLGNRSVLSLGVMTPVTGPGR